MLRQRRKNTLLEEGPKKIPFWRLLLFLLTFFGVTTLAILAIPLYLFEYLHCPNWFRPSNYIHYIWARSILFSLGITLEVKGLEKIPTEQIVILAPNHNSLLDIVVMLAAYWNAKFVFRSEVFYRKPFLSILAYIYDHAFVYDKESLYTVGIEASEHEWSLIIFPEGSRSRTTMISSLKKEAFELAKKSNIPIIPTSIRNSGKLLPPGSFIPLSGTITVEFLDILNPSNFDQEDLLLFTSEILSKAQKQ